VYLKSFPSPLLMLVLGSAMCGPLLAQEQAKSPADAGIKAQLEQLEYEYEVDDDNDYKLVFKIGDEGRSQIVYIRSPVETYGQHRVREIWSPAYKSPTDDFPALIANRLLEDADTKKLGGWVKQDQYAIFVVKIPADADGEALDDALDAAMSAADEMEAQLTPGQDDL
jgi:hypothetical protein